MATRTPPSRKSPSTPSPRSTRPFWVVLIVISLLLVLGAVVLIALLAGSEDEATTTTVAQPATTAVTTTVAPTTTAPPAPTTAAPPPTTIPPIEALEEAYVSAGTYALDGQQRPVTLTLGDRARLRDWELVSIIEYSGDDMGSQNFTVLFEPLCWWDAATERMLRFDDLAATILADPRFELEQTQTVVGGFPAVRMTGTTTESTEGEFYLGAIDPSYPPEAWLLGDAGLQYSFLVIDLPERTYLILTYYDGDDVALFESELETMVASIEFGESIDDYPIVFWRGDNVGQSFSVEEFERIRFGGVAPRVHVLTLEGEWSGHDIQGFGLLRDFSGDRGVLHMWAPVSWFDLDSLAMVPFTDLATAITEDPRFVIGSTTETSVDGFSATRIDATVVDEYRTRIEALGFEHFPLGETVAGGGTETWGYVQGMAPPQVTFWVVSVQDQTFLLGAWYEGETFLPKIEEMLEVLEFEY